MRLADTLVLLSEGRVAAVGTVEELTGRLDLRPLTGRYEAGAVIRTSVAGHDAEFGLTELAFPGGSLRVPRLDLPLGAPVRVRVRARDVVLALAPPAGLSIRNSFAGRVIEIAPDRGPVVDLTLDIGTAQAPVILWARITARALADLGLKPGSPVYALVKTVAIDRSSYGRRDAAPEPLCRERAVLTGIARMPRQSRDKLRPSVSLAQPFGPRIGRFRESHRARGARGP